MLDDNVLEAISPSSLEVPDYAKRWGDVSRIALVPDGSKYDKRISPEFIFCLKTQDNPEGILVTSLKCELCIESKQACNRRRPACERCHGKRTCEYRDSEIAYSLLLRQGPNSKARSCAQNLDAPGPASTTLAPGGRSSTSIKGRVYKSSARVRDLESSDTRHPTKYKTRKLNMRKSSVKHVPYLKPERTGKLS